MVRKPCKRCLHEAQGPDQIKIADDAAEKVVQVMRDSSGDGSHCCGFTHVTEAFLELHVFTKHLLQAQLSTYSRQSLVKIDRLGGEDDRDRRVFWSHLEMLAGLDAIHLGHHHIKQDQLGFGFFDNAQTFMSVMSDEDLYILPFKLTLEQLNVNRLIVDDEYLELGFFTQNEKQSY